MRTNLPDKENFIYAQKKAAIRQPFNTTRVCLNDMHGILNDISNRRARHPLNRPSHHLPQTLP